MRRRKLDFGLAFSTAVVAAGGCNSFDDQPTEAERHGQRLFIPTDNRPAVQALESPAPISGGTLLVTADGSQAVVSDPDRDQISLVALSPFSLRHVLRLEEGDAPGRLVEGPPGRVHAVLRGSGTVVTLDTASGAILDRRAVCRVPRGIAYDRGENVVHVACAEGQLVTLGAEGGEVARVVNLETDLRDVMVRGSEIWVTRFKSAEVLRLSSSAEPLTTTELPRLTSFVVRTRDLPNGGLESFEEEMHMKAAVAWRAVPTSEGGAVIVHQEEVTDEVELAEPTATSPSSYGGDVGGGFTCGAIVRNSVTTLAPDGTPVATMGFAGAPLPVDVAVSADGQLIAVAHAGVKDSEAPVPEVVFVGDGISGASAPSLGVAGGGPGGGASLFATDQRLSNVDCAFPVGSGTPVAEPTVAVAFTQKRELLVQTLEPPRLVLSHPNGREILGEVALSSESRFDTGHQIFHRDSGAGIACASCHPEGGEDGHAWRFSGIGTRRTQALHVGLEGTAPFHWDGDLGDLGALMSEVFVGRMGGVKESKERLGVLADWLFDIERPPPIRDADDESVQRGKALFHSETVGCSSCHAGSRLTDNRSVAVGTLPNGARLQVPSLVAIGYRTPFMHNGCARTLAERFDPECGGKEHGKTAHLEPAEIEDLVAYLESL